MTIELNQSEPEAKKIMEIYFFSGTGNSLPVAKELSQRFPGSSLIPICPSHAIQIAGRITIGKGRYHHPAISVKDTIEQKNL
jgi:hypothetical protein